jgi:cell division protein FtsW (lipid II flippase)
MKKIDRKKFLLDSTLNAVISGAVMLVITVLFPHKLWLSVVFFTLAFFVGAIIISKTDIFKIKNSPDE